MQTTTSKNRFRVSCCSTIPSINTQLSKYNNLSNGTTNKIMIIETDSTVNYLVFNFAGGTTSEIADVLNSIQIEENTTATDLEPYGKDIWYKYCRIGDIIVNGTENYSYEVNPNFSDTGRTRFTIANIPTDYYTATSKILAMYNIAPDATYIDYDNKIVTRNVAGQGNKLDLI